MFSRYVQGLSQGDLLEASFSALFTIVESVWINKYEEMESFK